MCQVNGGWSFSAPWGCETPKPIHYYYDHHHHHRCLTYQLDALLFLVEHDVFHFEIPAEQKNTTTRVRKTRAAYALYIKGTRTETTRNEV